MKIAYTGWTWLINHKDNEKFELEQSFKECKYLAMITWRTLHS